MSVPAPDYRLEARKDEKFRFSEPSKRWFDAVLVWTLDRFRRSLRHLVNALAELETLGGTFVSLRDNLVCTLPWGH